jgi:hypothetical protein
MKKTIQNKNCSTMLALTAENWDKAWGNMADPILIMVFLKE